MDPITKHHYENIANGTAVENADGTLSTVKTIIVEIDGMEVLIPTVWNGEIVDNETAIENAMNSGIQWPSDEATEEGRSRLQSLDDQAHLEMNRDTTPEEARSMLSPTSEDMEFGLGGFATTNKGITTPEGLEMAKNKFQLDESEADTNNDEELSTREREVGKAVQKNVDTEITEDDAVRAYHGGMALGGDIMEGLMGYDEVSGNPIPIGSSAENVRDDIDAKISTDEYVLPANVVKWHGLKHIQDMQAEAEMGLMSMNMEGLIQQVDEEPEPEEDEAEDIDVEGVDVEVAAVEVDDHLEGGKDEKSYPKTSKLPSVRQKKTVAYMV
jgi:hypothetical protein